MLVIVHPKDSDQARVGQDSSRLASRSHHGSGDASVRCEPHSVGSRAASKATCWKRAKTACPYSGIVSRVVYRGAYIGNEVCTSTTSTNGFVYSNVIVKDLSAIHCITPTAKNRPALRYL